MRRNEMTRYDAAHEWVREFNAIRQEMLEPFRLDGTLSEVTVPAIGDRVWHLNFVGYLKRTLTLAGPTQEQRLLRQCCAEESTDISLPDR